VFFIFSCLFWNMKMNWYQMLRSKLFKWLIVYLKGYTACRLQWRGELKRGKNKNNMYICCKYIFMVVVPKRCNFWRKVKVSLRLFASSSTNYFIGSFQICRMNVLRLTYSYKNKIGASKGSHRSLIRSLNLMWEKFFLFLDKTRLYVLCNIL